MRLTVVCGRISLCRNNSGIVQTTVSKGGETNRWFLRARDGADVRKLRHVDGTARNGEEGGRDSSQWGGGWTGQLVSMAREQGPGGRDGWWSIETKKEVTATCAAIHGRVAEGREREECVCEERERERERGKGRTYDREGERTEIIIRLWVGHPVSRLQEADEEVGRHWKVAEPHLLVVPSPRGTPTHNLCSSR